MNAFRPLRRVAEHLLGRVALVLVGLLLVCGLLMAYPPIRPAVQWALPVALVLWGGSLLYSHGTKHALTVVAAGLLVLGGITRALFQLVSMDETTGALANLVPLLGIFAEMYAHHYRERE